MILTKSIFYIKQRDKSVANEFPLQDIIETTVLPIGTRLTENVTLDMLTRGEHNVAANYFNATISSPIPDIPPVLYGDIPDVESLKKWRIAKNLQDLSHHVLEPIIKEYGRDLSIFKGYINPVGGIKLARANSVGYPISRHHTGEAVDFILEFYRGNMFHAVRDIIKILNKKNHTIVELGLVFNRQSWVHVGVNGTHGKRKGDPKRPIVYTYDMAKQRVYPGIVACQGYYIR